MGTSACQLPSSAMGPLICDYGRQEMSPRHARKECISFVWDIENKSNTACMIGVTEGKFAKITLGYSRICENNLDFFELASSQL